MIGDAPLLEDLASVILDTEEVMGIPEIEADGDIGWGSGLHGSESIRAPKHPALPSHLILFAADVRVRTLGLRSSCLNANCPKSLQSGQKKVPTKNR